MIATRCEVNFGDEVVHKVSLCGSVLFQFNTNQEETVEGGGVDASFVRLTRLCRYTSIAIWKGRTKQIIASVTCVNSAERSVVIAISAPDLAWVLSQSKAMHTDRRMRRGSIAQPVFLERI